MALTLTLLGILGAGGALLAYAIWRRRPKLVRDRAENERLGVRIEEAIEERRS